MTKQLNRGFRIPIEQLEDLVSDKLDGQSPTYTHVVPLRSITKVDDLRFFKTDILEKLLRNVQLRNAEGEPAYPYQDAEIQVYGREPSGLDPGQTFILQAKLLGIMKQLGNGIFKGYCVKGISKMPPVRVYGEDQDRHKAVGFYFPPIVEIHQEHSALIDGIHRSYLCMTAGTTINAIHIRNVSAPLPFTPISWENTKVAEEKPAIQDRYKNLRIDLFRDFSKIGIDG